MNLVPVIVDKEQHGERSYDIFSRLLKDRIILLADAVDDNLASTIIAQLLYLDSVDQTTPIEIFINSPGGSVSSGLAIYDIIKYKVRAPITTIGMGLCASMGAFLLASGTKTKRLALPNAEIMIHQPSGGFRGTVTDSAIQFQQMTKTKEQLARYLSQMTDQPFEKVLADTERDNYMTAEEAKAYGIIDGVYGA